MSAQERPGRIPAVDIFRGLTMAFMVLVNNPGDYHHIFPLLMHAEWNGWTPVDLVFPFFLFIVGVSISLSLGQHTRSPDSDRAILKRAFRRGAILFLLGLLDNGFPFYEWRSLRIPGVLQRIGLVSCLAWLLALKTRPRAQFFVSSAILIGYWVLMTIVPVPQLGAPDLSQRGGNLGAWLDRRVLGGHVWIADEGWDPEGILSTFPALCLALIGVMVGRRLLGPGAPGSKADYFLRRGIVLILAGLAWDVLMPINRWLWTSSFVAFAGGVAMCVLALCLIAMNTDILARALQPFRIFGANAIVVYLASVILAKTLYFIHLPNTESLQGYVFSRFLGSWLPPTEASLAWGLAMVLVMYGLAWFLWKRRIFIKI